MADARPRVLALNERAPRNCVSSCVTNTHENGSFRVVPRLPRRSQPTEPQATYLKTKN